MSSERLFKRRKLDTRLQLLPHSSAAARLADLSGIAPVHKQESRAVKSDQAIPRFSRENTERDGKETSTDVEHLESRDAGRSTPRRNGDTHQDGSAPNGTESSGRRPRPNGTPKSSRSAMEGRNGHTSAPDRLEWDGIMTDGSGQGDVVMADVDEAGPDEAVADAEDPREDGQLRTSGRKRQKSRKYQEAFGEESPLPKAKARETKMQVEQHATSKAAVQQKEQSAGKKTVGTSRNREPDKTGGFHGANESFLNRADTISLEKDKLALHQPKMTKKSAPRPVTHPRIDESLERKLDGDLPAKQSSQTSQAALIDLPKTVGAATTVDAVASGVNSRDDRTISKDDMGMLRTLALSKLTSRKPSRVVGLDEEYAKIANLIEHTIVAGESNSMMVIGARGSGKTSVIEHILQDQRVRRQQEFYTVRLSGFVHTDDKIALREIWRQLGKEMDVEDESLVKNYADTLTTLLAMLSHPSELGQQEDGQASKSIIFILDEFELFASHPRQTLLYNLFDIAQSRKAPIAVLGLTTRFDVAESLEKRVKSRFSHRQVHLPLARNFASFRDMCKSALVVEKEDLLSADSRSSLLKSKLKSSRQNDATLAISRQVWNQAISQLFDSNEHFMHHLHRIYYTTKCVPAFHTSMLMPIASLSDLSISDITSTDLADFMASSISCSTSLSPPDSKISLLPSLSTIQLALLIASARLVIIHSSDTVSFALAYDEYKTLASKARIQASAAGALATGNVSRVWGKETARSAWEGLMELELVMPVSEGRAAKDGALCRVDVGLEEIGLCKVEMDRTMGKWCKEI